MRILRIHINNLNSLRLQTSIDFEQAPLSQADIFAITGDTGAGKTTILDAITLALYGRVARNKDAHKEVMSYGAVECHAEVEFEVDSTKYLASWRMHRARHKADGNLLAPQRELAKWDAKENAFRAIAEKVREVDEAVRELTKLDFERFTRSVMLAQGDFAAFLKASEKDRSDLLERITGTGIYSELSSAAFEKYRQEEQQLKELQVQQEQLVLVGEETVTKEQLNEARKGVKEKTKALEGIQQQVQLLDRWMAVEERFQALKNGQVRLQEEEQNFASQAEALIQSKQLSPLRSQFQTWDFQQEQQITIQQKVEQLALALTQTQEDYARLEVETTAAATTFQQRKEHAKSREIQIQQAATLDEQFRHLEKQWQTENEQRQELQSELQQQEQRQQALQQQQKAQQQELEELSDWLKEHEQYLELPTVFPVIDQERTQLRERYLSQQRLAKKQDELRATTLEWEQKTKLLEQSYEQQDKALRNLHQKINQLLPEMFSTTEEAGIERLGAAIQDLQDKRAILQQLVQLDEAYQKSLREQEAYAERLGELLNRQQVFNKELLNLVEQREQQQQELEYRRTIYQQQQLLVNYEKDRQQLKPGDPCPLCLSTDHPFHEHPFEPFVDQAQRDFEIAEKQMQGVLKDEKELLQQEGMINQEIELLSSDEEKSNIRQVQRRILEYESQIAGLLNTQKDNNWSEKRGKRLSQHLSQLDQRLQHWRQLQKELTVLSRQINTSTTELQRTERNYLENKRQYSVAEAEQQANQVNFAEENEQFKAAQLLMNEKLEPFGEAFELNAAKETFARLEALTQTVLLKLQRQQKLQQALELNEVQVANLGQSLSKLQKQAEKQTTKTDKLAKEKSTCQQERIAILGEQTVADARTALEQSLERAEGEWQRKQEALQKQKEQLLAQQERLAENKKQAATNTKELGKVQNKLNKALQKTSFEELTDARKALLSEQEQADLEAEQQRIIQAVAQNTKALKETQQEWQKLEPEAKTPREREELRQQLAEKQQDYEQQLLQLGQLEEKHQQKQEREKRHKVLLERIEEQRRGFNRWARLNEVIGQRDGKKFRSFAQGLTLQRLIVLANQHLDRLNGRYFISKKESSDLELEIIDTFQAENRRSVFTLSGGESFLISLALALGLSDLAGRHAQIQSLFIDEGFSTLDEHSLDLAISTLENLRAGGKTIGIISHVKALKERIGTQIRLHKQSDGFSHISVQA